MLFAIFNQYIICLLLTFDVVIVIRNLGNIPDISWIVIGFVPVAID